MMKSKQPIGFCEDKHVETYKIIVINLNTRTETALSVEVDEAETTNNIVINAKIFEHEISSSNYNYLPAYQEFRDRLLQLGFGIKCNGSMINAVQSGMMGANDKMYLVEMGKKPQMKDIVHIWEYADIDNFPDTKQQLAFFEQWSEY